VSRRIVSRRIVSRRIVSRRIVSRRIVSRRIVSRAPIHGRPAVGGRARRAGCGPRRGRFVAARGARRAVAPRGANYNTMILYIMVYNIMVL
jgi:hypothetical protein